MARRLGDITGFNAPDGSIIAEDRVLFAAWFNGPTSSPPPPVLPGRPTVTLGTISAPIAVQGAVILPTATLGPGPY